MWRFLWVEFMLLLREKCEERDSVTMEILGNVASCFKVYLPLVSLAYVQR